MHAVSANSYSFSDLFTSPDPSLLNLNLWNSFLSSLIRSNALLSKSPTLKWNNSSGSTLQWKKIFRISCQPSIFNSLPVYIHVFEMIFKHNGYHFMLIEEKVGFLIFWTMAKYFMFVCPFSVWICHILLFVISHVSTSCSPSLDTYNEIPILLRNLVLCQETNGASRAWHLLAISNHAFQNVSGEWRS